MLAYPSTDSEPAIMGAVDDTHYSLVIAAAQAAGPCPGVPVVLAEKTTNIADLRGCGLDR
jgi:hypothetical protein